MEPAYDASMMTMTSLQHPYYEVNRNELMLVSAIIYTCLLYHNKKTVEKTLSSTTQHAKTSTSIYHAQHYQVSIPSNDVLRRRHEPVATDTVYADVPVVDCGGGPVLFIGRHSSA
jgi:hypothetical protein